jgi:hypothetical protein
VSHCIFSSCRKYRYVLDHDESDLLTPSRDYIAWIGLNPSIADEEQLDPTLNRIRGFTAEWGYQRFVMLNLFAFVSTKAKVMLAHPNPIGPENSQHLSRMCQGAKLVVCCWGEPGNYRNRDQYVLKLLEPLDLFCVGLTKAGRPRHPLYLSAKTSVQRFR